MVSVPSEVSKYMGNAVKLAEIWGSIIYNVKAYPYGAKGNAITDDTVSIQKAINTCGAAGGGIVKLPPGGYLISSTLINIYNNVIIEGSGYEQTYLLTNSNITMLQLGIYDYPTTPSYDGNSYRYFNQVKDIMFLSRYNEASPNTIGIELKGMCLSRIENCRFADTTHGIRLRAISMNNVIEKNTFGGTGKIVNCIDIYGEGNTANHNSTGNVYTRNHFLTGTVGINMSGNTFGDIIISDNIFISVPYAMKAVSPSSGALYAHKIGIFNNDYDGTITYALYMENCTHVIFNDQNIAPNISGGIGVYLKGCNYCMVQNNKFTHGDVGIQIVNGGNHSISDNQTLNQVGKGLILDNSVNNQISNNILRSNLDTITILAGSTSNRFNNNILSSSSGNKILTYTNDYSNLFIDESGNQFYQVFAGNLSGNFKQISKIINITDATVYTNILRIDVPTYSAVQVKYSYSMVLGGVGGSARTIEYLLRRDGVNVSMSLINDTAAGAVFDLQYDLTTTQGSVLVGIRRNAAAGGTSLNGSVVTYANGVLVAPMVSLT